MPFNIDDFNSEFEEDRQNEQEAANHYLLFEFPQMEALISRLEKYIAKDHFQDDQRPHDPAELLKQERELFREQLLELNRLLEKNALLRQTAEQQPGELRMHDLLITGKLRKLQKKLCDKAERLELQPPYTEDDYLSDSEKRLKQRKQELDERMQKFKDRLK